MVQTGLIIELVYNKVCEKLKKWVWKFTVSFVVPIDQFDTDMKTQNELIR